MNQLDKHDVENIVSYNIRKIGGAQKTLAAFETIMKQLYNIHDYESIGDPITKRDANALTTYRTATRDVKEEYRTANIVKVTGASVTVAGGILSFTPLAPIGWAMIGAGTITNATTDIVRVADQRKNTAWVSARDSLSGIVENPFADVSSGLKEVHDAICKSYKQIKDKVSSNDFATMLQCLGFNYFLFRDEKKMTHEDACQELLHVLTFFDEHQLKLTKDNLFRDSNGEAKQVTEWGKTLEHPKYNLNGVLQTVGAASMMGLLAGVGVGALVGGMRIASYAPTLARCLLTVGNQSMRAFELLEKAGPALAIIGGVMDIVVSALALDHIDETFKPYFDYADKCDKILETNRNDMKELDENFQLLFEALKKKKEG